MTTLFNTRSINNPTLYYKLDPGEPGLAMPAKASESIGRVASHEGGNIRRFRKEAMDAGGVVVYSNISLNLTQKGSFLAATSGKSEALIVIPAEDKKTKEIKESPSETEGQSDKIIKKTDEKISDKTPSTENIQDIKLNDLKSIIEKLKNEKKIIESNAVEKDSSFAEIKAEEIQAKISYLEQKVKIEEQKKIFSEIIQNKNFTFKVAVSAYNTASGTDSSGLLYNSIA